MLRPINQSVRGSGVPTIMKLLDFMPPSHYPLLSFNLKKCFIAFPLSYRYPVDIRGPQLPFPTPFEGYWSGAISVIWVGFHGDLPLSTIHSFIVKMHTDNTHASVSSKWNIKCTKIILTFSSP